MPSTTSDMTSIVANTGRRTQSSDSIDHSPDVLTCFAADGAFAAITAETEEARERGFDLARLLGLEPFELADEARPLYHAGAAIASNYLVTLHRVASELFRAAGAPAEALLPLMQRTIENGFELTGPIERGDWETVEAHRAAIRATRPDLEPLYDVLAEATQS